MITISLISAAFAVLVCLFGTKTPWRIATAGITTFLVTLVISYFEFPTVGWRFTECWWLCIIGSIVGMFFGGFTRDRYSDVGFNTSVFFVPGFLFALFALIGVSTSTVFRFGSYRNIIGNVEVKSRFSENVPLVDTKHIRLVSAETAHTLAKKALGQQTDGKSLGSLYNVDFDHGAVQEVRGELWWIFPLDYRGYFAASNNNTIPGYVRVSAQDPNREATLVTENINGKKFSIKYTPEAVFGNNLDRRAYNTFPWANREDITFEVDEEWNPYYTYGVTTPTIGFAGDITTGIILADPQNGECKYYADGSIPSWVDRVRPMKQALEQITHWGDLINGWLNPSGKDRVKPTTRSLWLVKLGDKLYWSTGITSENDKDDALLGVMLIDTRRGNGGALYFPMRGATEAAAEMVVQSQLGANGTKWSATHPTPYNIYGKATWIIPVVSDGQSFFQQVGLVSMENINIVSIAPDLDTALEGYRAKLAANGNSVAPSGKALSKKMLGPVRVLRTGDTIVGGNKTFFFSFDGYSNKLFTTRGAEESVRVAPVVHIGDMVTITFLDTDEAVVPIESMSCAGLQLQKSSIQKTFEVEQKTSKDADAVIKDSREAEAQVESLSAEKKQELLKLLREKKEN